MEGKMKNDKKTLWIALAFFLAGSLNMSAQKTNFPTSDRKPPVILLTCPDIKVVSFTATLVSTQVGLPLVEFPHDKVSLEVIFENVGGRPVPSAFIMDIFVKRNGGVIYSRGWPAALGAPGSRCVMDKIVDSFPHGAQTTYSVEVRPMYNECSATNNQASFTVDETQLHRRLHK
jgi:hypothetical protein